MEGVNTFRLLQLSKGTDKRIYNAAANIKDSSNNSNKWTGYRTAQIICFR